MYGSKDLSRIDKFVVSLGTIVCPFCKSHIMPPGLYMNAIDHEIIECLCLLEIGVKNHNPEAFNDMMEKWHSKRFKHKCKSGQK